MVVVVMLIGIAQAEPAPPNPATPSDSAAEVIVSAQRAKLSAMRVQITKVQETIYADYNKLNTDREYAIVCTTDMPTDSHIPDRNCLPVFAESAQQEAAQDFMSQFHLDGHAAPPASMVVLRKRYDFIEHYKKVIHSHPELLKLDGELGDLEKRYEAARKQKLNGKIIGGD